jgi:predicted Rossmann fold nucleotide-binding protein DprA/Smf involved in DNA uptake
VLNRSEPAYPRRLKERLRSSAPVLLFGYGDITLARRKGVAIVGSRNATRDARDHAHALAERVVAAGYSVVSGGARGIDEVAVDSAIEHGGTAIAVLPASLLRYASKRKLRDFLATERLVLVTPYSPEAGFTAGNAIGRNKLIYCLADTAVAMCSTNGSGGTYAGGIQDLQKQWVPLWVAPTDDPASGNHVLVEAGARWLPTGPSLDVHQLFDPGDPIHGTAVDQASATPQQQAS